MKNAITFVFLLILSGFQANAQQQKYPKGAYMSFEEIVKKTPSKQLDLTIEKRSKGDIKMVGGNDYKLTTEDKSIEKKMLKTELWAYSLGDTLFINCFQYKVQLWYACIISDGKYLIFKGGLSQNQDLYKKQMKMAALFGAMGGAFAGAKMALMRFVYIIEKSTNILKIINSEALKELLADRKDLLEQYEKEANKEDDQIIIKYLELINTEN